MGAREGVRRLAVERHHAGSGFNIDASLIKNTWIGRFATECRIEAFNLLNHLQVGSRNTADLADLADRLREVLKGSSVMADATPFYFAVVCFDVRRQ